MTSVPLPPCLVPVTADVGTGVEWQQQHATWVYQGVLDRTIVDHVPDGTPEPHAVTVHEIGRLPLPTGRVDAGDMYLARGAGYQQPVPAGDHPCLVAEGTIAEGHQRVMAALLITGTAPVVRWTEGFVEPPADDLAVGDYHGFGIDSGLAAFLSPAGEDRMIGEFADDDVYARFDANGCSGALLQTVNGQSVAVFPAGWGDGHYPTWFGLAADGSVSVVMADFFVFTDPFPDGDEPEDDEPDGDTPDAAPWSVAPTATGPVIMPSHPEPLRPVIPNVRTASPTDRP